ncbi:Acetyltransferase (GNAT) family protein [Actibacterium lipolyticum]|uniref:Acetyltransferase (GNAT) family protein n=2 Tax=Actibacterium lipolyticum TaxID=1524263 RepID=A0A238JS87_9RHOB|nr:Acetyltransferase (GNAT) family protein [Actibacterium lipolyticum]
MASFIGGRGVSVCTGYGKGWLDGVGQRGFAFAMSDDIKFRDLQVGDAGWIIQRHGELYAAHDGFDATFEALVAEILAAHMRDHDPSCERAWIAHRGDQRVGSIFCVKEGGPGIARLRLFLIEPTERGHGLGHKLLAKCINFAREAGYQRLVLNTHESHKAACALYAAHGFRMTMAVPVHSFGQDLVEQSWQIDL